MNITELLQLRGLNTSARIKLVRHQDKRYDVHQLARDGKLEVYQAYQSAARFDCDYIIAFLGEESRKAVFWGVYRVLGRKPAHEHFLPNELEEFGLIDEGSVYYDFKEEPGFEDFRRRVVIDWGTGALAWHQWLSPKEIIEVLPAGYVKEFPGFLELLVTFHELVDIVNNPDANREWHRMLSSVAGIYLIVDQTTGSQYVGSAYGAGGIMGRWGSYASSGHGGNAQLVQLLGVDPSHVQNLTFSVLQTLPRTLTKTEVIQLESVYKRKLGSRAFGLNSN